MDHLDPLELKTAEPFSTLFPINPEILEAIAASMWADGFDPSKPINVWREGNIIVDGHTRRLAAIKACLSSVPVSYHDFVNEDLALKYAIANQRDRRNITNADMFRCVEAVDKRKTHGGDRGNQHTGGKTSHEVLPSSAETTARIVGTSRAKVEKIRTIIDHSNEDPTLKQDVLEGRKSISMAAREVKAQREKSGEPKRGRGRPKKTLRPGPSIPAPAKVEPSAFSPSTLRHSDEDEAWLSSFPLRARVVAHRFDEDALIYRRFEAIINQIKPDLVAIVGKRSEIGMSLLHRALHRVSVVPPIRLWEACVRCNGTGAKDGMCRSCHGGGYTIPNL